MKVKRFVCAAVSAFAVASAFGETVTTVEELRTALAGSDEEIVLAPSGSPYEIAEELVVSRAVTIRGGGDTRTAVIVTNTAETVAANTRVFSVSNSKVLLAGLTITGGRTTGTGGGVNGSCTVSNCVVRGNYAGNTGSAGSDVTFLDCEISGNSGAGSVGCALRKGSATRCEIVSNTCANSDLAVSWGCALNNCLIAFNKGGPHQFGLIWDVAPVNCTIVSNTVAAGGTPAVGGNNSAYNCIVWDNYAGTVLKNHPGTRELSYCCTYPEAPGIKNITDDPLLNSDFTLRTGSPCINAGNAGYAIGTRDLAGNPRTDESGMVDLGCYEKLTYAEDELAIQFDTRVVAVRGEEVELTARVFCAAGEVELRWEFGDGTELREQVTVVGNTGRDVSVRHVYAQRRTFDVTLTVTRGALTESVTNLGAVSVQFAENSDIHVSLTGDNTTGDSFAHGLTSLSAAVAAANSGCRVLVAPGVYDLSEQLEIVAAVEVIGTGDSPDQVVLRRLDDVDVVCRIVAMDNKDAVLRNVTVTGGIEDSDPNAGGGGILLRAGTVRDCHIIENRSTNTRKSGGGIWMAGTANAVVSNCVVRGNSSKGNGGGIYAENQNAQILDSEIAQNTTGANGDGGGVDGGTVRNCFVWGNSSTDGGAFHSSLVFDTVISNNVTQRHAPIAHVSTLYRCTCVFNETEKGVPGTWGTTSYDCLFADNHARNGGGYGMTFEQAAYNCTFVNNRIDSNGYGGYDNRAYNCVSLNNWTGATPSNYNASRASSHQCLTWPLPENGEGNIAVEDWREVLRRDYTPKPGSPAIDAALTDATHFPNAANRLTDLAGNPRRHKDGAPDLGCYEFCGAVPLVLIVR